MMVPIRSLITLALATFMAFAYASTLPSAGAPRTLESTLINPAAATPIINAPTAAADQQQLALTHLMAELRQAQFRCSDAEILAGIAQRLQVDLTTAGQVRDALLHAHDGDQAPAQPVYSRVTTHLNPDSKPILNAWLREIAEKTIAAPTQNQRLVASQH